MTTLLSLLLVSTFTLDYFAIKLGLISRLFTELPELFSVLILLAVIGRSIVLRRWEQPVRYVWLLVTIILVCMIGAVAEAVNPGPLISGMRNYFKFFPLLLLPAVYEFSDKQLRVILGIFLVMVAIQVPLAFFQRFVQFSHLMHTGDPVTGTVTVSSSLTMVLCQAIALVMTLYVHRKIPLSVMLLLFCFLAAPTTLNETKATVLLLPIATLGPALFARGVASKWRKVLPVVGICVFGLIVFVTVYNDLVDARWGGAGITEFFGGERYEHYLYRGSEEGDFGYSIGRVDSMVLPVKVLSDNWMQLLFGLGIGNVSPSPLPVMEGAYAEMGTAEGFGMTAIGNLIWETGVIGLVLHLLLFAIIWRDTRRCGTLDVHSDSRWYYTWWSTCIVMFVLGFFYKSVLQLNELGYMVFFWSGVVVSRYWRIRHSKAHTLAEQLHTAPRLQLAGR